MEAPTESIAKATHTAGRFALVVSGTPQGNLLICSRLVLAAVHYSGWRKSSATG